MRGEEQAGRREGVGRWRRKRHARGGRLKAGGQGTRGAHGEHVLHGCDAGRVEAQRLVEGPRVLPSQKEVIQCGARCRPEGGRVWGGGGASGMHGKAD